MDFIVGLTPSTNGYDAIFVCVDKFFTMAHFMSTTTHDTVEEETRSFCDHVYKLNGLLKVVPSNKNTRFTIRFWNVLHGLWGTRLAMSTTFHPQTNGQMKWLNHVFQDMLQHYVNPL